MSLALMVISGFLRPAHADSGFEVRPLTAGVLTAVMLGSTIAIQSLGDELENDWTCPGQPPIFKAACDPNQVLEFDRWILNWRPVPWAAALSDGLLVGALSAPFLVTPTYALASSAGLGSRIGDDLSLITQTYAAVYLTTHALKAGVRRLRPFNYDPESVELRVDGDSRRSFPSGHTSMAFASAALISIMVDGYGLAKPSQMVWMSIAWSLGLSIGTLRVLAHRHFPTDVIAGAILGTTLGLLIPYSYRATRERSFESGETNYEARNRIMSLNLFGGRF